jgi:hypothetical protein
LLAVVQADKIELVAVVQADCSIIVLIALILAQLMQLQLVLVVMHPQV